MIGHVGAISLLKLVASLAIAAEDELFSFDTASGTRAHARAAGEALCRLGLSQHG